MSKFRFPIWISQKLVPPKIITFTSDEGKEINVANMLGESDSQLKRNQVPVNRLLNDYKKFVLDLGRELIALPEEEKTKELLDEAIELLSDTHTDVYRSILRYFKAIDKNWPPKAAQEYRGLKPIIIQEVLGWLIKKHGGDIDHPRYKY